MCQEGVQNKSRYLDNEYLSCGIKDLPVRSTLPIMYAQFSEYTTNFGCVDGETKAERISRWSKIAEQVYEAEVFTCHKKMNTWESGKFCKQPTAFIDQYVLCTLKCSLITFEDI